VGKSSSQAARLSRSTSGAFGHASSITPIPKVGGKVKASPKEETDLVHEKSSSLPLAAYESDGVGRKAGRQGEAHVDPKDPNPSRGNLPSIKAGPYKGSTEGHLVDTHKTEGDFQFKIVP